MKLKLKALPVFSLLTVLAGASACATTAAEPAGDGDGDTTAPVGDGGGTATGGIGAGGAATGGAGTATGGSFGTGGSAPLEVEAFLPMTVTDYFAPSGMMGEKNTEIEPAVPDEVEGIVMDSEGCAAESRPAGAAGECFKVTYTPQYLNPCTPQQLEADPECEGTTWAGAFFQSPENNWGTDPGVVVEKGATKIVFTAWTDAGEQELNFIAGGIGDLSTEFADTFKTEVSYTVTTTPTQYEIDLTNQNYEMVLGGFCWTVAAVSSDDVVFYLDDIRWVTE